MEKSSGKIGLCSLLVVYVTWGSLHSTEIRLLGLTCYSTRPGFFLSTGMKGWRKQKQTIPCPQPPTWLGDLQEQPAANQAIHEHLSFLLTQRYSLAQVFLHCMRNGSGLMQLP